METARRLIEEWLPRMADQRVFSPNEVQGLLFDLYGELPEGPSLEAVKQYLSLTIERELFGSEEMVELLSGILVDISEPTTIDG